MYDKNNIFAKIIRGEAKCNKVYENDFVLAFEDIFKASPIHILIIPKKEYIDFCDFVSNASNEEISSFFKTVEKIADLSGAKKNGFRLISNVGTDAHQTVKHFHVHLLAGKSLGPLISSDKNLR